MDNDNVYCKLKDNTVNIKSVFQPLYSVQNKKYCGVEALSRGELNTKPINAQQLFSLPSNAQENYSLNMHCIMSSLIAFSHFKETENLSVFINFDSALIDCPDIMIENILQIVHDVNIVPSQIVIELIESKVTNFSRLLEFVNLYRRKGFLIALDDVGSGYSNFERIVHIQPDVLKIDISLVNGISNDFYKQSVCKSLIELSHSIGCLALAEGIENLKDALMVQELGVDIIQGFYFSKPVEQFKWNIGAKPINELILSWQKFANLRERKKIQFLSQIKKKAQNIATLLQNSHEESWDSIILTQIHTCNYIQCVYVLDEHGLQTTKTAISTLVPHKTHLLFNPAKKETDHSFKSYYVNRRQNQKWFISDPYVSNATGYICRTINLFFKHKDIKYLLCLDVSIENQDSVEILK